MKKNQLLSLLILCLIFFITQPFIAHSQYYLPFLEKGLKALQVLDIEEAKIQLAAAKLANEDRDNNEYPDL